MAEQLLQIFMRRAATQRATTQPVDYEDGVRGMLRSRYSAYDGRWRLWLLDLSGEALAGPIRVVPGINLLQGFQYDSRVPQGELFSYSSDASPPDAVTMDSTAVLFYRKAA